MPRPRSTAVHQAWVDSEHYAPRLLATLSADPAHVVIHWRNAPVTAERFASAVLEAARAFARAGVDDATIVAVLTEPNSPAMLTARYAAHLLGATIVYIRSANPRSDVEPMPGRTQTAVLRRARADLLVVDQASNGLAELIAGGVPILELAGLRPADPGPRTDLDHPALNYLPDRQAVIGFTSGSTREPKMISHSFRAWNALVSQLSQSISAAGPPCVLATTPISHTMAPMVDAALATGGSVVLHEAFDPGSVLRDIHEQRITHSYLAMPHLYQLLDDPDLAGSDLSSLRQLIYSGTPAAPARVAEAVGVFGDCLVQVYGTTESGGISSLTPLDHRERQLHSTVGRPFPWVRLEIRDRHSGNAVERGDTGEIWTASPTLMHGYLDDAESTAQVMRNGWLRTGDLGHLDKYGYLNLDGRVAEVIKVGGLKVNPAAVEQALLCHPAVANAAVYGLRGADYIEVVHAAVQLRVGARCTGEQLRAHVGELLSPLASPSEIELWTRLPLNDQAKPDKTYLRSRHIRRNTSLEKTHDLASTFRA